MPMCNARRPKIAKRFLGTADQACLEPGRRRRGWLLPTDACASYRDWSRREWPAFGLAASSGRRAIHKCRYVIRCPVGIKNGVDETAVERHGRHFLQYSELSTFLPTIQRSNVPVLWWRSVGHTHNAFVMETLIDELATRAKIDPIAYRRKLVKADAMKLHHALDLMDERSASWRSNLPQGHALGIACHEAFGTAVACAVDLSIENKRPKIHRVTIALDPGIAVNPLTIESQFQAGVAFGVSQIMAKGAITLKDGRVEQRNFDGYTPPYIVDAPVKVDVHIVPSTEAPTGCGEPPVPVISPAVVNALFRLTGKRYRSLPLTAL